MADTSKDKKIKLASTRKRFKELQELKKKRSVGSSGPIEDTAEEIIAVNSVESSNRNTPVDHQNLSGQGALVNYIGNSDPVMVNQEKVNVENRSSAHNLPEESSNLPNYFNSTNYETPTKFFDNISPSNESQKRSVSPSLLTYFNTTQHEEHSDAENIGMPKYFDNYNSSSTIWENTVLEKKHRAKEDYRLFPKDKDNRYRGPSPSENGASSNNNDDVLCQDDPEIQQNEVRQYQKNGNNDFTVGHQHTAPDHFNRNMENIFSKENSENLMDYLNTTGATTEEKEDVTDMTEEIDQVTDLMKKEVQHSNVENLRQLSNQLAQMIEPSYDYSSSGSITDLEKRNIELAANLEREKVSSEQLRAVNQEYQARIAQLETELKEKDVGSNLQDAQEIIRLKDEFQTHLQTIGMLVAEKTELSSNLSQYELSSKQKSAECEELQARLKASRSRVADLEREMNNVKAEKNRSESVGEQYSATLDNLRLEYGALKEQKDELVQDLLEVREKLKNVLEENVAVQQENRDLGGKLSLSEIKIQQLSSGGISGFDIQVEQLTQQKFSLENELSNLNQMLKSIIKERDESNFQYQQYAQQLNGQITNLSSKLEQLQQEKENLLIQEQNRIKHIGDLERQLQNLQNDQVSYVTRNSGNGELKNELENCREMCVQLQIEKTKSEENYTKISNEKELLLKEVEAKIDSISQLELMVEQLRGNQPDSVKLLATMESDKVAASRAIQQNKELKRQLESMQEVFMKMDNDKVVLTENLKAQQQTNKELIEKLQKTELTLQSLADAIEIKDRELSHLREHSDDLNRQALQHEQLEDRLRHYEAHNNSSHILQHELQDARQTIAKLTNELNKNDGDETEIAVRNELEEARRKILELNNEINRMQTDCSDHGIGTQKLFKNLKIEDGEVADEVDKIGKDRNENMVDKENATKYLEEKVKRTMQEIADLTEEKQRLEHIVLQLQGETETIGEYVALYQHQRMVLKQKAQEKDEQLKQLASDREQIKVKLDRLNQLIKKLVSEKGSVPPELLQHQESMNSQLNNFCEEHSKIHEEINSKITQSNDIEPEDNGKTQTAEEIISLLSEIKTSNLVQPNENFHHCPWCSGQLIVV